MGEGEKYNFYVPHPWEITTTLCQNLTTTHLIQVKREGVMGGLI